MKAASDGVALTHEKHLTKDQFFAEFLEAENHFNDTEKKLAYLDPAWAKAALGLRTLGAARFAVSNRTRVFPSLLADKKRLDAYRKRVDAGNGQAILAAIKLCAEHCLPLPEWLAIAFSAALERFTDPHSKQFVHTLDDAFPIKQGSKGKPEKVEQAKRDWSDGVLMWRSAWDIAKSDATLTSVDAVLKIVLKQKRWGVKLTKTRRLVLWVDESQAELLGKREKQPLSQMLAKRRKR